MPRPALHRRTEQANIKMIIAPELSLRGAKRRGNLGKAVAISPMAFPHSDRVLRDCTPRALPRASRSGRHVGLRPPRNDKFRGIAPLNLFRNHCQPAWRSLTAAADAIGLYVFIVSLFLALVRSRARLSAPLHFPLRCRKIPPGRVFIPAGM